MDYYQKYKKYKVKYDNLIKYYQKGGVKSVRAQYEEEIYKISNTIVENVLSLYGTDILNLCQTACCRLIIMLQQNPSVLKDFKEVYKRKVVYNPGKSSTSMVTNDNNIIDAIPLTYIQGSIHFDDLNVDDNPVQFVKKHLENIRTCLSFLDISAKFFEEKAKEQYGIIISIFDNFIRNRKLEASSGSYEICIKDHIIPGSYSNSRNFARDMAQEDKDCVQMSKLHEQYSKSENEFAYKDDISLSNKNAEKKNGEKKEVRYMSSGVNIFTENNKSNTIDVFSAGISGHTFDTIVFFILFMLDTNSLNTTPIFYYIVMACLIWMISFYHHSFKEIVAHLLIFCDQKLLSDSIEKLFKIYDNINNQTEFDTNVYNGKSILSNIMELIYIQIKKNNISIPNIDNVFIINPQSKTVTENKNNLYSTNYKDLFRKIMNDDANDNDTIKNDTQKDLAIKKEFIYNKIWDYVKKYKNNKNYAFNVGFTDFVGSALKPGSTNKKKFSDCITEMIYNNVNLFD